MESALLILWGYFLFFVLMGFFVHKESFREFFFKKTWTQKLFTFFKFCISFTCGSLLSSIFLFYWYSGSAYFSFPIFLLFIALAYMNERKKIWIESISIYVGVFFVVLMFLSSISIPVIFQKMDSKWFLVSGMIAAIFSVLFFQKLFSSFTVEGLKKKQKLLYLCLFLFACNVLLFFTNVIPPIPLSLQNVKIEYTKQDKSIFFDFQKNAQMKMITPVFAPKNVSLKIVHDWEWFDVKKISFKEKGEYTYKMIGGKKTGYTGYSQKTIDQSGLWRVKVKLEDGRVIGVVWFFVRNKEK